MVYHPGAEKEINFQALNSKFQVESVPLHLISMEDCAPTNLKSLAESHYPSLVPKILAQQKQAESTNLQSTQQQLQQEAML